MADSDRFRPSVPACAQPYRLKGSAALDWGMQSRLARVFRPATGRTVMLAIDHGYFQGPTTGLERVDLAIVPLLGHADALMATGASCGPLSPRRPARPSCCGPAAARAS